MEAEKTHIMFVKKRMISFPKVLGQKKMQKENDFFSQTSWANYFLKQFSGIFISS